jgi:hypothetical protein
LIKLGDRCEKINQNAGQRDKYFKNMKGLAHAYNPSFLGRLR